MNTVLELTNIITGNKALLARLLLSLLLAAPWVTTASADDAPFLPNLSTLPASPSSQQTFLSAEQAFEIDWVANDTGWTVSFDIEPGYYLYLERIKLVGFEPGQVEKPGLTEKPRLSFRQLPETKFDKNFGLVEVFHDRLNIEITHAGLSTLVLSWQGCSDQQLCYPPQKTRLHAGQDMDAIPSQKLTESDRMIGSHIGTNSNGLPGQRQIGLLQVWQDFVVIGLSLLFTSCVIPLIPMVIALVSSAQQQHPSTADAFKGLGVAAAFVLGVASSHALIGALAASLGASVNLVALTQTPWVIYLAAALVAGTGVYLIWPNKSPDSDREAFFNAGDRLVTLPDISQTGHGLTAFVIGFTAAFIVSPCISAPIGGALTSLANQANPLLGGSAMFVMGLTIGLPVMIAAGLTSLILSQQPNTQQLVRPGCGLALMFVALILVDRVVNDSILLGITGIFALALGVYFGGLNGYRIPKGDEVANPNPVSPLEKARQAGAMVLIAVGLIWMIGSAMGNKSWLQPLASETSISAASTNGLSGLHNQPSSLIHRTPDALLSAINNGDPRMVVVDITADWCSGCEDLNRLLDSQRIQSTLATSGIRLLRFDITHTQREQLDLLASLGVFGPPALQPFSPTGSPLGSPLHGVPSASELSDWLITLQP